MKERREGRRPRGHALLIVLMTISTIALVVLTVSVLQSYQARLTRAVAANRRLQPALESALRTMQDGTVALAARRLGRLSPADVDTLRALLPTLTLPAPLVIDSAAITFEAPRVGMVIPAGARPLYLTSDYPRVSWSQDAPWEGFRVDTLVPVRLRLTISGEGIGRIAGEIVLGVAQIPADQAAIQTDGPMELCTPSDSALPRRTLVTSGLLLSTGSFSSPCNGVRYQHGPLFARDSAVRSAGGVDTVLTESGKFQWGATSLTRASVWAGFTAEIDAVLGHIALINATGTRAVTTYQQTSTRAGFGECVDGSAACSGAGAWAPALTIQRRVANAGTSVTVSCGAGLTGAECTAHQSSDSWSYYERPPAPTPGVWQGLFPDPRREDRCTWASPRGAVRTFRCPTNSYGHVIRVGVALGPDGPDAGTEVDTLALGLPPIPGGLISIVGHESFGGGPSDFSEVVLLRNAEQLTGPFHLVSNLPVVIEGSFNVNAPVQPAAITAPMITVLPEQSVVQAGYALLRDANWAIGRDSAATERGWAGVWDSTTGLPSTDPIRLDVPGPVFPQRLTAYTPVVVNAVLRSTYEPTIGGIYRGGVAEQIPAVLGDWSSVSLTVNGTLYGRPAAGTWSPLFRPFGTEFSGLTTIQPKGRFILQRNNNATAAGAPPGSFAGALYAAGSPTPSRPASRQSLSRGGAGITVMLSPLRRLPRGRI